MDWYDGKNHFRYPKVADYNQIDPTDALSLLDAVQQRKRERAVKMAHFEYIQDKVQKCYMFHGASTYQHQCRHLIHEFIQTRDELAGWKQDKKPFDYFDNAHRHYDPPAYFQDSTSTTDSNTSN